MRAGQHWLLGDLYEAVSDVKNAKSQFTKSVELYDFHGPEYALGKVEGLKRLASIAQEQNDQGESVRLYKVAIAIQEQKLGPDHDQTAQTKFRLGEVYGIMGNLREAERLYKEVLPVVERERGATSEEFAYVLNALAEVLRRDHKYDLAEPMYRRALNIYLSTKKTTDNLATVYNNLGIVLRRTGRLPDAERSFLNAIAVSEATNGKDNQGLILYIANLARVYDDQKQFPKAETTLKRAIKIARLTKSVKPSAEDLEGALEELYENNGRVSVTREKLERQLDELRAQKGEQNKDVVSILFNLANSYHREGRLEDAIKASKRALEIAEALYSGRDLALIPHLSQFGVYQGEAGDLEKAAESLDRAIEIIEPDWVAEKLKPSNYVSGPAMRTFSARAKISRHQGRCDDAVALSERAVRMADRLDPNDDERAIILDNFGTILRDCERYEEAVDFQRRALGIFMLRQGSQHIDTAIAKDNLATSLMALSRLEEAETLMLDAIAVFEKHGSTSNSMEVGLGNLSQLRKRQGRFKEALTLAERGLKISLAKRDASDPVVLTKRHNIAGLHFALGAWELAERSWVAELDAAEPGARIDGLPDLIKATYRRNKAQGNTVEDSFFYVQRAGQSSAGRAVSDMAVRSLAADRSLSQLVRERQDLAAELARIRLQLARFAGQEPGDRDLGAEAAARARLLQSSLRLKQVDGRMVAQFPAYSSLVRPVPMPIADVQKTLNNDEALVLLLDTKAQGRTPEETFLWVVTKDDVRWVRSPLGTESLTREVAALRCGLDYQGAWAVENSRCKALTGVGYTAYDHRDGKPLPFDVARAHALFTGLFGEVADMIAGKQLIVVPSGLLTQLPFHTLVTKKPKPGATASDSDIAWLARTHAITVLPAVSSLKALRRNAKASAAPEPFIGFGDPVLTGQPACGTIVVPKSCPETETTVAAAPSTTASRSTSRSTTLAMLTRSGPTSRAVPTYYRNGLADVGKVRELCPLPDTLLELTCVASSLGAKPNNLVVGPRMTETAIKSAKLDRYRIIHFATHGLLAGETAALAKAKAEPALVMSPPDTPTEADDGLLMASEIAGLKLDADWVVMSACNTAGGGAQEAEALSGLARAFFYAGARALLVSHWHVNSVAATLLTSRTFAEMRADPTIGRAEAFRRSMLALMADTSRPWAAHPSAWAPFVVVGEGAAVR